MWIKVDFIAIEGNKFNSILNTASQVIVFLTQKIVIAFQHPTRSFYANPKATMRLIPYHAEFSPLNPAPQAYLNQQKQQRGVLRLVLDAENTLPP